MRGTPTLKRTASSLSLNQRLPVGHLAGAASTANTPLRRKISTVGLDDLALRASPSEQRESTQDYEWSLMEQSSFRTARFRLRLSKM